MLLLKVPHLVQAYINFLCGPFADGHKKEIIKTNKHTHSLSLSLWRLLSASFSFLPFLLPSSLLLRLQRELYQSLNLKRDAVILKRNEYPMLVYSIGPCLTQDDNREASEMISVELIPSQHHDKVRAHQGEQQRDGQTRCFSCREFFLDCFFLVDCRWGKIHASGEYQ